MEEHISRNEQGRGRSDERAWHRMGGLDGSCRTTTCDPVCARTRAQVSRPFSTQWWLRTQDGSTRATTPKSVVLGDGTPVNGDAIKDIERFQMSRRALFLGEAVTLLSSTIVLRCTREDIGKRRVLAAIGGPPSDMIERPNAPGVKLTLHSGDEFPAAGCGWWKVPKDVCADVVFEAIKAGYRHLDSACDYGNEVEVGLGISRAINEGIVTRRELFVTSKQEYVSCSRARGTRMQEDSRRSWP